MSKLHRFYYKRLQIHLFLLLHSQALNIVLNETQQHTLTGPKLRQENLSKTGPIPSIQLPEPYTQFTGDNSAPDAHFNSSFPKSQQKSPLVREYTFSHLKKRKKINIWFQYMWKPINSSPDSFFFCLAISPVPPSPSLANGK